MIVRYTSVQYYSARISYSVLFILVTEEDYCSILTIDYSPVHSDGNYSDECIETGSQKEKPSEASLLCWEASDHYSDCSEGVKYSH